MLKKNSFLQVLLDTSFVLTLVKQHRDPWAEIRALIRGRISILVLDLVVLEMERLARTGPSTTASWAKASLDLIAKREHRLVEHKPGPSDVDSSLLAFALTERVATAIATVDRGLRMVLAVQGIPAVWPRRKHGLMANGVQFQFGLNNGVVA